MSTQLPRNVLVVEDEIITQVQVRNALMDMGIRHIDEARDARQAKEKIGDEKYDFILMDINLGLGEDGITLAKDILDVQKIPIVFMTAYTDDAIFEETLELFPYGFLGKPFIDKELQRSVRIAYSRFSHEEPELEKVDSHVLLLAHGYHYDLKAHRLYKDNKPILLKGKSAHFVDFMCQNLYTIVGHDVLLDHIWHGEATLSSLRTLVHELRKQMPDFPIVTHSKLGYSILRR
jgi:DNA-binding response OmpR family regulator